MFFQVTCSLPSLPAGSYQVSLTMQPVGLALQPQPPLRFNVTLEVDTLSPDTGGTAGRFLVVITGRVFPSTLQELSQIGQITFGGKTCNVTSSNSSSVTCLAPPNVGDQLFSIAHLEIHISLIFLVLLIMTFSYYYYFSFFPIIA